MACVQAHTISPKLNNLRLLLYSDCFLVGYSHNIGVSSVVCFHTACRDSGTSFADDALIVRHSNPLLSAIRVEQTTNKSSVLFCINGLCASPYHFSKTKQPAAIALLRLFSVWHSHSIGVSSVVYFRTAFRDCGTSFADDALVVRHSNPLLSAIRVEQTTNKSSVLFCINGLCASPHHFSKT